MRLCVGFFFGLKALGGAASSVAFKEPSGFISRRQEQLPPSFLLGYVFDGFPPPLPAPVHTGLPISSVPTFPSCILVRRC